MRSFLILSIVIALAIAGDYKRDEIKNLPGLKHKINFRQFSGYRTVDSVNQRQLFYWFVESQNNPATDPVVLWLNGGPGCSSLGGFFTEQGPFRPHANGIDLAPNNFAWNRNANVIFLESPAGVGFSKSNNQNDYTTGDVRTADDVYHFLLAWFADFKHFQNRPFWVSGESYAGHYVPETTMRIYTGNQNKEGLLINIQGFLAGNAWTYMPIDNRGAIDFWWSHSLISDETYQGIVQNCNFSDIGPLKAGPGDACDDFLSQSTAEMGNVNIYDIYVNVCSSSFNVIEQLARAGSRLHHHLAKAVQGRWPPYHPCAENFLAKYLNRADVQQAIHANISYPWVQCSQIVNYNYSDVERSVIPLYEFFTQNTNLSLLVYSGDVDAIVPITGTRAWLATLAMPIKESWRPWSVDGQVGGYVVVYDRLTFSSVRNAGHMVPETQPARALAMFESFIFGKPFPPAQ